jgi:hypothetical protein
MQRWFRVRNFDALQHYKSRNPPWIKLYNRILDDYDVASMADAAKWHFVAIMLLASRNQNRVPWDIVWVSKQISATETVDLDAMAKIGFIEEIQGDDMLARRKHDASKMLAQRREEKTPPKPPRARGGLSIENSEWERWKTRLRNYRPGAGLWLEAWGPRPETGLNGSIPTPVLEEWKQNGPKTA